MLRDVVDALPPEEPFTNWTYLKALAGKSFTVTLDEAMNWEDKAGIETLTAALKKSLPEDPEEQVARFAQRAALFVRCRCKPTC